MSSFESGWADAERRPAEKISDRTNMICIVGARRRFIPKTWITVNAPVRKSKDMKFTRSARPQSDRGEQPYAPDNSQRIRRRQRKIRIHPRSPWLKSEPASL